MTTKLVIGLDGASWNLLEPWIESGDLPNIKRFRTDGVWEHLHSYLPPVTSPNWKCYSTGKNPGKLGVYWWEIVDREAKSIRTPDSTNYRSAELWDYLGDSGKCSAVINMPTSFPPREIDGWMIAGGPGTEEEDFARPKELHKNLLQKERYSVHPTSSITSRETATKAAIDAHIQAIESRFDIAVKALESGDFDVIHVTTFYINVLQHFFWDQEPTHRAWKVIDEKIGELMAQADTVFLMSDHGCNEIDWEFRINRWLEEEGYLTLTSGSEITDMLDKVGATRSRLLSLAKTLPFDARNLLPSFVKNKVPSEEGTIHRRAKGDVIDWKSSKVIASGQGPLYILDKSEREQLSIELREKLKRVTDPEGAPVFKSIHRGKDVYDGPYLDLAPDLVVEQNSGYHIPGNVRGNDVFSRPARWLGENRRLGIFAAWGDDIAQTGRIESSIEISDLFPTILHLLGEPVPTDVDGLVRKEVFAPGSKPHTHDVKTQSPIDTSTVTDERESSMEDHLRDLGYL